jgi:hypothetical protein
MKFTEIEKIPEFGELELDRYNQRGFKASKDDTHRYVIGKIPNKMVGSIIILGDDERIDHGNWQLYIEGTDDIIGAVSIYDTQHFNIPNSVLVKYIQIAKKYTNIGIGYSIYEFILSKGLKIISDENHTDGSQALWQRLTREHTVRIITDTQNTGGKITLSDPIKNTKDAYTKDAYLMV